MGVNGGVFIFPVLLPEFLEIDIVMSIIYQDPSNILFRKVPLFSKRGTTITTVRTI